MKCLLGSNLLLLLLLLAELYFLSFLSVLLFSLLHLNQRKKKTWGDWGQWREDSDKMSIDWRQRECDGESARWRHRSIRATLKRHEWWRQRTLTRWTLTETQHVSVYCFTSTGIRLTLLFFSLPPINNLHLNVIDDDLSPVIQEYYSNTSITWILQIPVCSDQNNKTTKMKTKTHSVIM